MPDKKINCILIAEVEGLDLFRLNRTLDDADMVVERRVVHTLKDLRDYVLGREGYADREANPDPEVLLLQPDLPDGDALNDLATLKAAAQKPFVTAVVSANGSVKRIREAYAAGAETFLAKPVRSTDIINFFAFQKLI